MVQYGGDEVSALVVDIGSSSLRAGYAGDDTPKSIIPTTYGYHRAEGDEAMDVEGGDATQAPKRVKMYIGQNGPSMWRAGMETANPMVDGLIDDFAAIPPLIEHALVDVMRCTPSEHPILVTEPPWNTPANRERMAEIMFEEFQVPAFYIANTGVLNAFAAGKGTALVIDVGKSMASVTPVVDGFVLRKGLSYSPLPKLVQAHARHILVTPTPMRRGIELLPHQLIANKTPVDLNAPPRFTLREERLAGTTESWRQWAEAREVDEWIQSVAGVLEQGWNDQLAAQRPPKPYEFPTGYNTYFGGERLSVGEQFFYHPQALVASNPNLPKHLPALISDTLRSCDAELRQVLSSNVVVTGGGTLFAGFVDRLSAELTRSFPHAKIHAPGNPIERRYGGWLGGSILASLGTFHQLWISKEEWQEHGKAIVGQRCK
ncbi:putative actin family protein [Lyophyllum shimeji]|uniref:Actin family protein n=1 Tax=Lyophyllum shimeji TaxID=47721 RepID=A0A9P3PD06_LYOSH|nr:putative actin family protein [Lyophyllum shimeji]